MRRYSKHRGTSTRSFMAIWLLAICSLVYGTGHLIGSPKVQSVTHPISNTFSASVRPSLARITNLPRHAWAKAFSGRASPLRKFNVAVSEYAGYHDEVLGAILHSLTRMPEVSISLYRNNFRWQFDKLIDPFFHQQAQWWETLPADLAEESDPATRIDLLVLTSCDYTLERRGKDILDSWEKRTHKFRIGCVLHEAYKIDPNGEDWQTIWSDLTSRNAIDFYVLSPHVVDAVKRRVSGIQQSSPNSNRLGSPADRTAYNFLPPVFPVGQLKKPEHKPRLSRAIIQGNIEHGRRDYTGTYAALEREIRNDPELFGYYLSENGTTFLPLPDCTDRFQLTLLGLDRHEVFTPQALIHVVRRGMEEMYADFYQAIADQDIVIPAFATDTYLVDKASSSVAAALLADVPVLASDELLDAYDYLDGRVTIHRPPGVSEMQMITQLRRGSPDDWVRSPEDFAAFRESLYKRSLSMYRSSLARIA
ncbi:hypothetical protein EMMF5_004762 [Cystobasidiomycetes sp. EMM_F5]